VRPLDAAPIRGPFVSRKSLLRNADQRHAAAARRARGAGRDRTEGWTLRQAFDISADGRWIADWGGNPLSQDEVFRARLSMVPVPAAVWMLFSALGGLAYARKRQRLQ
jgi:hypothetical protein